MSGPRPSRSKFQNAGFDLRNTMALVRTALSEA